MTDEVFMRLDGDIFVMHWGSMKYKMRNEMLFIMRWCGCESLGEL